jgi:hypothetical protein
MAVVTHQRQRVDKYPRTTCEHGNHVHTCKHSYSAADVNEQRNMVNSGVRGTKNNHLMIEMDCIYYLSYRNLAPTVVPVIYTTGAPGDFVASGSAGAPSGRCGHARAA